MQLQGFLARVVLRAQGRRGEKGEGRAAPERALRGKVSAASHQFETSSWFGAMSFWLAAARFRTYAMSQVVPPRASRLDGHCTNRASPSRIAASRSMTPWSSFSTVSQHGGHRAYKGSCGCCPLFAARSWLCFANAWHAALAVVRRVRPHGAERMRFPAQQGSKRVSLRGASKARKAALSAQWAATCVRSKRQRGKRLHESLARSRGRSAKQGARPPIR